MMNLYSGPLETNETFSRPHIRLSVKQRTGYYQKLTFKSYYKQEKKKELNVVEFHGRKCL